jgi:hypothetical protein
MNLKQQIKEKEAELLKLKEQLNSSDPKERIKTFEDACEDQGINPKDQKFQYRSANSDISDEEIDNSGPAFERLKVIQNSLLGDKKLVWGPNKGFKHFPRFDLSSPKGSGFFASADHWANDRYSCISSRLALDSSEKAIYFGEQFEDDWYEYMIEHKIK